MFLRPDSRLFGVAPEILIDGATELTENTRDFDLERVCEALGAPVREVAPVLRQMIDAGFVEQPEGRPIFAATAKLRRLASAKITEGIPRLKAEQLLQQIIAKATQVNAQPNKYPRSVACLVVFGSYLREEPVLGDLDIGIELGPERPIEFVRGKHNIWDVMDREVSEVNRTYAALRLRKPKLISLHELKEVLHLQADYKVVFGEMPNKR